MVENNLPLDLLIGLEIHITVKSKKKIFNWEDTYYSNNINPNNKVGPWELGYLGFLPIINPEVIELGLKLAVSLEMTIAEFVVFDRKIYNSIDLPKGYQITQKNFPIATNGFLEIITKKNSFKKMPIKSIQLEEDAAKIIYSDKITKLDFNRSGNPLIELVTDPIFKKIDDVIDFIKQLQILLIYLDISDAKMENGQMRIDLNYSLSSQTGYQTPRYEIKNLNSLSNIKNSIEQEMEKHFVSYKKGELFCKNLTLRFNEQTKQVEKTREKQEYLYVPEFNIPPIKIEKQDILKAKECFSKPPIYYLKKMHISDYEKTWNIIKHPSYSWFLKSIKFIDQEKESLNGSTLINWALFCFNFLIPLTNDKFVLEKKWDIFRTIFDHWQNKTINKEKTTELLQKTETQQMPFFEKILIDIKETANNKKEYNNKTKKIFKNLIISIWNKKLEELLLKNEQRVFNFIFGKIKKENFNLNYEEIAFYINGFLKKKKEN